MKNTPILVTGSHRSGSTWVGDIIARSPLMHYVHEPFNIDIPRPHTPIAHWYEYLDEAVPEARKQEVLQYLRQFQRPGMKDLAKNFLKIRSFRDLGHFLGRFFGLLPRRTVYKDPIGLLASAFFYKELQADIVVVIRHPAAFVSSIKEKNWGYDFREYLDQAPLMDKHLAHLRHAYEDAVAHPKDIIDVGILQWISLYGVVQYYQKTYGSAWYFVRHEDLSTHPMEGFAELFKFLDIPFNAEAQQAIIASTTSSTSSRLKRDSAANVKTWQKRLSPEDIERIRIGTESVWRAFYNDSDWE